MPAVNYVIYGCSSSRKTPGAITIQEFHTERKNIVVVISRDRVIDDNFKRQIKNRTLYASRLFLHPAFFNIFAIGQNYLSIYPPSFFNIHRVNIFPNFSR